jgi:hypothetical protein
MTEEELIELVRLGNTLRGHRWPWAPLGEILGGSLRTQADRLGVDQAQVSRWRRNGLTDKAADRCGIRAGLHPAMIWPNWHDVMSGDGEELEGAA